MKQTLLCLIFVGLSFSVIGQTIAYPSYNPSKVLGASCADLRYTDPVVIGHQINVSVEYYETLSDAQNGTNALNRFYDPTSDPQTIYARVDSLLDDSFDVAESILDTAESTGGPPPGISSYYFDVCDIDGNGNELVYLDNLRALYNGYGFPTASFCNSVDSEVVTTFYLTESDALNETNPVNPIYTLSGSQIFHRKIKNTITNEFLIDDMINVTLVTCTQDTDGDGIADLAEDVNRNLEALDDDTDMDGLKNYEDDDDDGDGILTIDEDYNGNGDPTDDDTNMNGVPDYLEANITLSVSATPENFYGLYPNPTSGVFTISNATTIQNFELYNQFGQLILSAKGTQHLDISDLSQGLYMMILTDTFGNRITKKVIKK